MNPDIQEKHLGTSGTTETAVYAITVTEISNAPRNSLAKGNIPITHSLPQDWFARPSPEVAPDLLGTVLVRQFANGDRLRCAIVETEAYAPGDPACHAYKRKTQRNQSMFGPAGHLYVYLIYGMYHCLNIVTDAEDIGSAVLVRAVELDRLPAWIPNKKRRQPHRVAAGPGLLCKALSIDRQQDGWPLQQREGDALWIEPTKSEPESRGTLPSALDSTTQSHSIVQTTRIGLTQGADIPWRWYLRNHPAVSKY
ncbi:MAG: DNA-3-methyladenine glycosylase [Cyanobacteria bacterium P01_E01_bin.45]